MNKVVITIVFLISIVISIEANYAKIVPIKLNDLIKRSDYIVLGKCQTIIKIEGVRVAKIEVIKTIKGKEAKELYYLSESTWACDISGAVVNETALYFLNIYEYSSTPKEILSEGTKTDSQESVFRRKIESLSQTPFLKIAHSGRGKMPLRMVNSLEYVTLWTDDVILPDNMKTIAGPEEKYSDFISSVKLDELLLVIGKELNDDKN